MKLNNGTNVSITKIRRFEYLSGACTIPVCYFAALVACNLIIYQIKKIDLSSREATKVDLKQDIFSTVYLFT